MDYDEWDQISLGLLGFCMMSGPSLQKALSLFRSGYEVREMKLNKLSAQTLALETAFQEREKNLTGSGVEKHQMRTKLNWVW